MNQLRKQRPNNIAGSRLGLIILNRALQPLAADHGARMILADCDGHPEDLSSTDVADIPPAVAELLRSRSWTSVSGTSVMLRGSDANYKCTLFRVESQTPAPDPAMMVLHFERGISPEDAIHHIAESCNLTLRELEVLRGLSMGMTSKEIAAQLEISPNTVKSYIRLIMVKIGVTTRSGIVGKLLEHAAGAGPHRTIEEVRCNGNALKAHQAFS